MNLSNFIKKLLEENKKYFTQHKAYVLPEIPEEKLKNIIKNHNLSDAEEIFWAVDNTLSGSAVDSTIITNFGIIFRQKILGQVTVKKIFWTEIEQFFYDKKRGFVFINKKGEQVVFERMEFNVYYKKDTEQIDAICKTIEQIVEYAKFNAGELPVTDAEKKFIDDVKFMLDDDATISETEQRILEKIREKYGITEIRANEIIEQIIKKYMDSDEMQYFEEVKNIITNNGEISESDRRALEFLRQKLGIDKLKAKKIELLTKK